MTMGKINRWLLKLEINSVERQLKSYQKKIKEGKIVLKKLKKEYDR